MNKFTIFFTITGGVVIHREYVNMGNRRARMYPGINNEMGGWRGH